MRRPWATSDRDGQTRFVVLAVQGAILATACALGVARSQDWIDLHDPDLWQPLCLAVAAQCAWSFFAWRWATRSWFDPYMFFLMAAFLFNAGQAMLDGLGLNAKEMLEGRLSHASVADALALISLCLAALHFGALWSAFTWPHPTTPPGETSQFADAESRGRIDDLRLVGWGLMAVALPAMTVVLGGAIREVMASGYLGLYGREADVGIYAVPNIIGSLLVPAALFLLAGSKESTRGRYASFAVLLVHGVAQLYLGFRYTAVMPLVAYAWVWHRCIRPVPFVPLFCVGLVLMVVIFPYVRRTRNMGADQRSTADLIEAYASAENPAFSSLAEMGGTMMVTGYTLDLVPSTREFEWGASYFYALLTLFPNVAWDIHPSIAYGNPSHWLIWRVNPWLASRGGGYGYSFIAEAYLNFGWYGAPWFVALVGFCHGRLVQWAQTGAFPARVAVAAAFSNFFVFYAREEASFIVRPLTWYSFIPFLLVLALGWQRRRLAARETARSARVAGGTAA